MPSQMADIESGLDDLRNVIVERGIRSIAIPPLGSGLGKLPWPEVKRKIAEAVMEMAANILSGKSGFETQITIMPELVDRRSLCPLPACRTV